MASFTKEVNPQLANCGFTSLVKEATGAQNMLECSLSANLITWPLVPWLLTSPRHQHWRYCSFGLSNGNLKWISNVHMVVWGRAPAKHLSLLKSISFFTALKQIAHCIDKFVTTVYTGSHLLTTSNTASDGKFANVTTFCFSVSF